MGYPGDKDPDWESIPREGGTEVKWAWRVGMGLIVVAVLTVVYFMVF